MCHDHRRVRQTCNRERIWPPVGNLADHTLRKVFITDTPKTNKSAHWVTSAVLLPEGRRRRNPSPAPVAGHSRCRRDLRTAHETWPRVARVRIQWRRDRYEPCWSDLCATKQAQGYDRLPSALPAFDTGGYPSSSDGIKPRHRFGKGFGGFLIARPSDGHGQQTTTCRDQRASARPPSPAGSSFPEPAWSLARRSAI